ncbi:protein phosphatase methylesterase 1 [Folsomia candida]|uniref:Protein phosphatase methylesterase 1 n=1 Tax=Folsomia candida TaxID=158441 RepID=A0A226DG02_FOLCA|nr:protein phosphatase methylesterase 1 [Folsomia candida]OXA44109.1 Protein phosphatase methylesterase 1 [Folsomia candida]
MDARTRMFKEMMSTSTHSAEAVQGRKVPYLLCPVKKPEEYSDNERNWLKQRDEGRKSHSPSGWWNYFQDCVEVKIRNGDSLALWTSRSKLDSGSGTGGVPVSGGGGGGISNIGGGGDPFILFLHGGGYSGLTWGPMIDELSRLIVAQYGALDLRGHGESRCWDEDNLSLETLTMDILDVINWLKGNEVFQLANRPLIIVGHSMGGALGVNVSLSLQELNEVKLAGLVVLDVVEGSALLALNSMQFVLRNRPREFESIPDAIQWCTRSGQTKNVDSARISMTGQIMQKSSGKMATQFVTRRKDGADESCDTQTVTAKKRVWEKEDNSGNGNISEESAVSTVPQNFVWRINLSLTEPHWKGWYQGLSKKFLSVRCPKLLMLAGLDRLDKELTVGQMQGKFQMQVFHQVGHAIHEDVPDKGAECLAAFLCRQRIAVAKGHLPAALPGC